MEAFLSKISSAVHSGVDFLLMSMFIVAAGLLIPEVRKNHKNYKYTIASVMLGTIFGITAKYTPAIQDFQFIAVFLGAMVGVKTVSWMSGKTLKDVLKEYIPSHKEEDKPQDGE